MSLSKKTARLRRSRARELAHVGWREWVVLKDIGARVKAKIDTGARTSSLHAYDVEEFRRGKRKMVRFSVHPEQRNDKKSIDAEAPLVDYRNVRPSSGHVELRPVVSTWIEVHGEAFEVELTLTNRDQMGFRMLLGRQALRGRFLVDPARSFLSTSTRKRLVRRRGKPA